MYVLLKISMATKVNKNFCTSGGSSIFSLFTNETFFMFFPQVQTPLYLTISFLSRGLGLLCYPTGTRSKGFLCSHLVAQAAWITPPITITTPTSQHIIHSYLTRLILSRIVFLFLYVFFICIKMYLYWSFKWVLRYSPSETKIQTPVCVRCVESFGQPCQTWHPRF